MNAIAYEAWLGEVVAGYRRCRKSIGLENKAMQTSQVIRTAVKKLCHRRQLKLSADCTPLETLAALTVDLAFSERPESRGQKVIEGRRNTT